MPKEGRLGRKLTADLFGQQLIISQVGVALACTGVALFEVGVARAK